jgi:predicted Zn-dependent protease
VKKFIPLVLILCLFASVANAKPKGNNISTIRDEETETFLKEITRPVFKSAGLSANSIKIIIVNDDSINAFVSGGQNIFVNTGIVTELDDPSGLIGILAHETGHIKAAHILQKGDRAGEASGSLIAGYVLGIGSVLLGAPAEAGFAVASAGQQVATRNFLSYSRKYESEADSVALNILRDVGISPQGLVDVLRLLKQKISINMGKIDEYSTTHPVTDDRINFLLNAMKADPTLDKPSPTKYVRSFKRIKAKIIAFLGDSERVMRLYGGKNTEESYYAMAILAHKKGDYKTSMEYINRLIEAAPNDPYYIELKGQVAYESGRIQESIDAYKKALSKKPGAVLFTLKLAISQAALADKANLQQALSGLKTVVAIEPKNQLALRNLGIVHGKLGEIGLSYMYLAQDAVLSRKFDDAKLYIDKAEARIPKNTKESRQLEDIKLELKKLMD